MRTQLLKSLATISFLIAISIVPFGSVQSQTIAYRLRANIPFDFIVTDKKLPSGEYFITRTRQYASDDVLTISSVDGHVVAILLTNSVQTVAPKKQGVVLFNRYGNQHFLNEVWPAGSSTGKALLKSRVERELEREAKNIARNGTDKAPATVTVIGSLQ
jgi:hypothetical protein